MLNYGEMVNEDRPGGINPEFVFGITPRCFYFCKRKDGTNNAVERFPCITRNLFGIARK